MLLSGMPLTLLTYQQDKIELTPTHHNAFLTLKDSVIQAPILHYPNPTVHYIVYTDASHDACGAQLSQEYVPSLTHNRNGAPQNKMPSVYITQSWNGTITFKELKS